jgi:hypothetical protein
MRIINENIIQTYDDFILLCLYPEILNQLYKIDFVYRKNTQSIKKFKHYYEHVMKTINIELNENNFKDVNLKSIHIQHFDMNFKNIHFFRNYIFTRYDILDKQDYPKVILMASTDTNIENIKIDILKKYNIIIDIVIFENDKIEKQIEYFYNASIILFLNHVNFSNIIFCKTGTFIYGFENFKINNNILDVINILNLKYLKL